MWQDSERLKFSSTRREQFPTGISQLCFNGLRSCKKLTYSTSRWEIQIRCQNFQIRKRFRDIHDFWLRSLCNFFQVFQKEVWRYRNNKECENNYFAKYDPEEMTSSPMPISDVWLPKWYQRAAAYCIEDYIKILHFPTSIIRLNKNIPLSLWKMYGGLLRFE